MHLGIVAPLPPTPSGVAEWVGAALPLIEQHARVTCFVPDVEAVSPELRADHDVRSINERHDPSIDTLVYHIGNNRHHEFVFNAILDGPPGIVEVHDGSLHHYVQDRTLGVAVDPVSYAEFGGAAHGWAGRRLAQMRVGRYRGAAKLFLFDYLQPMLDRSTGVVVHSRYAEELVQLRCPRVHTWRIPLHAPELHADPGAREWTGIPDGKLLVAHLGFVTMPKRADVYVAAMKELIDRGVDAHFVFAGKPDPIMARELPRMISEAGLRDRVTITGYLDTADLEKWVQAVDVIVNLRAPHVGESSGSLAYGLAAGKPVIVQPIGSWAEYPDDVVVRLPVTDDDAGALASTLFGLAQDRSIGTRFGERAQAFARSELSAHDCVERLVCAAQEAMQKHWTPPAWSAPARTIAALTLLQSGKARVESMLGGAAAREVLERIAPARPHAKLLALDVPDVLREHLSTMWGYEVDSALPVDDGPVDDGPADGELALARYDVVVIGEAGVTDELLAQCNRMLVAQGRLAVMQADSTVEQLDRAGFSPRIHWDDPGWVVPASEPQAITVGTKANLPLSVTVPHGV
jgi:glycosyltransferase involved in cell wall biosynthesis